MSYDITKFKLKTLDSLAIPIDRFYIKGKEKYHPVIVVNGNDTVSFHFTAGGYITGVLEEESNVLNVTEFDDITSDGSGYAMDCIIIPALVSSVGYVEFTLIWENGDYIETIIAADGEVARKGIEL